eukprot:1157375-Pelagomonas_calceolata.AAC.8
MGRWHGPTGAELFLSHFACATLHWSTTTLQQHRRYANGTQNARDPSTCSLSSQEMLKTLPLLCLRLLFNPSSRDQPSPVLPLQLDSEIHD